MQITERERAALRALADAMLEALLATEEAREARRLAREKRAAPYVPAPNILPPEAKKPGLLSAKEAADYLSIGARSLWARTAPRGPIPSVRFGRAVRYPIEGLDAFIAESSATSQTR